MFRNRQCLFWNWQRLIIRYIVRSGTNLSIPELIRFGSLLVPKQALPVRNKRLISKLPVPEPAIFYWLSVPKLTILNSLSVTEQAMFVVLELKAFNNSIVCSGTDNFRFIICSGPGNLFIKSCLFRNKQCLFWTNKTKNVCFKNQWTKTCEFQNKHFLFRNRQFTY